MTAVRTVSSTDGRYPRSDGPSACTGTGVAGGGGDRRPRLPRGGDILDDVLDFPEDALGARVPHLGDLLLEIARVGGELGREGGELHLDGPPDGARGGPRPAPRRGRRPARGAAPSARGW